MARPTREAQEAARNNREEIGRGKRVPLGVARSKLDFPARPGYVRRIVNDTDGRIAMAEQAGYTFVLQTGDAHLGAEDIDNHNRDIGSRISRVVNKSSGQKGYLMEIKEEFYKEDQAAKAAFVKEKDDAIRLGKLDDDENRYIPDKGKGIRIETRK